jgi:hypothetical protein
MLDPDRPGVARSVRFLSGTASPAIYEEWQLSSPVLPADGVEAESSATDFRSTGRRVEHPDKALHWGRGEKGQRVTDRDNVLSRSVSSAVWSGLSVLTIIDSRGKKGR